VIASHYAEPVRRVVAVVAVLREGPSEDSPAIGELAAGQPFLMLDDTLGWAWGYAGDERRVGHIRSSALAA
jgi:hypothetical protein